MAGDRARRQRLHWAGRHGPAAVLHALHFATSDIIWPSMVEDQRLANRLRRGWRAAPDHLLRSASIVRSKTLRWAAGLALPAVLAGSLHAIVQGRRRLRSGTWPRRWVSASRQRHRKCTKRNGIAWVEVADPRSRRGDKLQADQR